MTDLDTARQQLADAMEQRGDWPTRSPWIRDAVTALPRDTYAPDRLYDWDGHQYQAVNRSTDRENWIRLLYADQDTAAVTQVTDGMPTSSLSCQAVVVDMLDSLLLEPGHQVLELGTGTGWNAALTAWRTGPDRVFSVEVDPQLATTAQARLTDVLVRTGDGAKGWPTAANLHDRVIATYAVDRIPWAWIEQTRPGGRIVTPWGHLGHVALTVADDGRSASGWIQGLAQFMPARDTTPARTWQQVRDAHPDARRRPIEADLRTIHDNAHLLMALRVALPDVRITTAAGEAWAHDGVSSWAHLGIRATEQGGPRSLADEIEAAWEQWGRIGAPDLYDYGMTVTADQQYLWANDPQTGPRWPAHAAEPALSAGAP